MTKLYALTKRNFKEIIRDPFSLIFCLLFPVFMLVLMRIIFKSMPDVPVNFTLENYSAGICVFGFTFLTLFCCNLIASDKNTEFINRIRVAPVKKITVLSSYFFALVPIAFLQKLLFFAIAAIFGLRIDLNLLIAFIYLIPSEVFYILTGILIGSIAKNEKQGAPFASIIVTVTGIFGGVFMPVETMGGFYKIVKVLPFVHTVKPAAEALSGNFVGIFPHILWILGYGIIIAATTFIINRKKQNA